jgi:hypothetical protein
MLKQLLALTFLATLANPALAQLDYAKRTTGPDTIESPLARRETAPLPSTTQVATPQASPAGSNGWLDAAPVQSGQVAPSSAGNYIMNQSMTTSTQGSGSPNGPTLKPSQMSTLDKVYGGSLSLPPTCLDSFVQNAGGKAFQIYGDEGTDGPPPLDDFQYIDSGIQGGGLTTGHASGLPSSWDYPQ